MNIVCDKSILSEAVAGVSKAVTSRSNIPTLEGILLKAEGFQLTLTGYDMEIAIITTIEANVREPGEVVLSAKLLGDMVRRIQSDNIEITCDINNNTIIKGEITEYNINGMDAGDFPDLPNPDAENTLDLTADILQRMINSTIYAVSTDDKKPAHTGELFSITPENITLVALDGYRLAITSKNVTASKEIDIIIPQKTMAEVTKLIGDDEETIVHIAANRRFVVFSTTQYTIISRLIEGEFLDYARVIPTSSTTNVVVDTRDFIQSIERASLIITERLKNPLRILFEGNNITVRCQTTLGKVVDELSANIDGDSVEIGFNYRYLLDALKFSGCDKIKMAISGPLSPVKITPVDNEDFIYLVLPVRFKND